MIHVPHYFRPLLSRLVATFGKPATARRILLFSVAAILTVGDRTVSNVLRLLSLIDCVHPSTYHCLFSHRRWNSRPLAFAIATFAIGRWVPKGEIRLCGDETVDGNRGTEMHIFYSRYLHEC